MELDKVSVLASLNMFPSTLKNAFLATFKNNLVEPGSDGAHL